MTLHLDDTMKCTADMWNCLFVPYLSCSLFLVRSATADGTRLVIFGRNGVRITDSTNRLITTDSLTDGVYNTNNCPVCVPSESPQCSENLPHDRAEGESNVASKKTACLVAGVSADLWHRHFDHLSEQNMNTCVNSDLVKDMAVSKQEMTFCELCRREGTPTTVSETIVHSLANILDMIHSDVCSPLKPQSLGGKGYFVTITDECSRCVWVRFIRDNSEVSRDLVKELEKGTWRKVKALRSGRGDEYLFGEFLPYLKRRGIDHQLTTTDSPEQNGVAERMIRELLEKARAMMAATNIPNSLWAEAIANAAYTRGTVVQRPLCKT